MRPRAVVTPRADRPWRVPRATSAVVVGGGIAGVSAALVLAERGVRVTLLEAADHLGGRLGGVAAHAARTAPCAGRARLPRLLPAVLHLALGAAPDRPGAGFLRPLPGYPVISRAWPAEDFASLPGLPPLNLLALVARSPSLRLRDLRHVDRVAATMLLEFDRTGTYAEFDGVTATELLDRLAMPDRARAVLFEVFGHSFFNREEEFSAAELVMMFHFYFLANPEGLGMDVTADDHGSCIWAPLGRLLSRLGAGRRDRHAGPTGWSGPPRGWRAVASGGSTVDAGARGPGARPGRAAAVVGRLGRAAGHPGHPASGTLTTVRAVRGGAVLDRPAGARRPAGVLRRLPGADAGLGDRLLATGGRAPGSGPARTGGEVIELHAYAAEDGLGADQAAARMWTELAGLWPEVAGLRIVDRETRVGHDAPGFPPGSDASRPGVRTGDPTLLLAGDWVRLPFASALMERAATTGVLAAGDILTRAGARAEPVSTVRPRGLLAR